MTDVERYAKYPKLSEYAQDLPPEMVEYVLGWHNRLATELRGFRQRYPLGPGAGFTVAERAAAAAALDAFHLSLQEMTGLLHHREPSDWCCLVGMDAYPLPCPQHAAPEVGSVRWVEGERQVWLADGWHHLGRRIPKEG